MARSPARSDPVHRAHALRPLRLTARLAAALLLALLAAFTSWLRTPVSQGDLSDLRLVPLEIARRAEGDFVVTGLWHMQSGDARFGGYSALLLDGALRLQAFSDRGRRLSFGIPDLLPNLASAGAEQAEQQTDPGMEQMLFDIESAARDPASGRYWLGFEGTHAVHRFGPDHRANGHRLLDEPWPDNGGAESLTRLADGRFALIPEAGAQIVMFDGDPVDLPAASSHAVAWPASGFLPTDAAQLPDGRLLVLMRRTIFALPPSFDSILVAGVPPEPGQVWRPEPVLRLGGLLPRENYEGLVVRALPRGKAELWLISDDNFSAFQRTLLARLELGMR